MFKLGLALLIGLCSGSAALAQGTFQFTWHGNSNLFQASFEVTDAEMQPGAVWNSPLFFDSIGLTSPSGLTYHYDNPSDGAVGGCYANGTGWWFDMSLVDFTRGTEVFPGGQEYDGGGGLIHEKLISGTTDLWYETGYWTSAYVPEPSTAALLVLGLTTWFFRRRRGGS